MESRDKDLIAALEKCGFRFTKDGEIVGSLHHAYIYRSMLFDDAYKAGWEACKQRITNALYWP
jgi:hypothetical protein